MRDARLICLSAGTHGSIDDVRPLLALALGLRARGYEIRFLADVAFRSAALRAGITRAEWFACSEVPQTFWHRTAAGQRELWGDRPRYWDRWVFDEIAMHRRRQDERFWRKIGVPDQARIVAAIGSIAAADMLPRFGPRCAKIISAPTPYPPGTHDDMFHLVSASPSILPAPDDWLPNMQITGYTPLDADRGAYLPPASLRVFLDAGPPPIYVGFGGLPVLFGPHGERRARAIIEGCRSRGVRCILHSTDVPRALGSDDVHILDGDVSEAWLFPRCAAIVHHGAYDLLHAALLARRPIIIYPLRAEQVFWAARLRQLGLGPGDTVKLRALTGADVARDLARVLERECQENAAYFGARVMHDDGLANQLAAIESIVEHTRRGRRLAEWQMPARRPAGHALRMADARPARSAGRAV